MFHNSIWYLISILLVRPVMIFNTNTNRPSLSDSDHKGTEPVIQIILPAVCYWEPLPEVEKSAFWFELVTFHGFLDLFDLSNLQLM